MSEKNSNIYNIAENKWIEIGSVDKDKTIENISNVSVVFFLGDNHPSVFEGHELAPISNFNVSERKVVIPAETKVWIASKNGRGKSKIILSE